MTCEQSRDEYIAAVEDLIEMSRVVSNARAQYIEAVREHPLYEIGREETEWRRVTDGLERLVAEERKALLLYSADSKRHRNHSSNHH